MKVLFVSLAIASITIIASCKKTATLDKQETFRQGQCKEYKNAGTNVKLCFNELVEDSRCPVNAMCIWAGAAVGSFTFTKGNETVNFNLSTLRTTTPKDTIIAGYKIELIDITPYRQLNSPPPLSEIKAEVKVSKI